MLVLLALISAAASPLPDAGYVDRSEGTGSSTDVILRISEHSNLEGGTVRVEQKLRRLSGNRYLIDFEDQPAATKIYHEALCLKDGMVRGTERGILGGEDAIAVWSCQSPDSTPGTSATVEEIERAFSEPTTSAERSTDYSFTRAPSGSALVGQRFVAEGSMSVKSSVAGMLSYSVSVDNRRCIYESVEHRSSPFEASAQKRVSCTGHRQGFLSTEMRACVPRACGASPGTYSIR